jgi:hypothetical protein
LIQTPEQRTTPTDTKTGAGDENEPHHSGGARRNERRKPAKQKHKRRKSAKHRTETPITTGKGGAGA